MILKRDADRDFAILKVDGLAAVPPLRLSDVTRVQEGDDVLMMGFPEPFPPPWPELTSTRGIVAAKVKRPVPDRAVPVVQFKLDFAVNHGNSGGPLISLETAEVIGMVSAQLGRLSENLKMFKEVGGQNNIIVGGVNYAQVLKQAVTEMDKNLNLGLGYAVSNEYIKAALDEIAKGPVAK